MRLFTILFLLLLVGCQQKQGPGFHDMHWIDLTHTYDSTTLYWPNNITGFQHTTEAEGRTQGGFYYSSYSLCTPEHGGTHLDAPVHFAENKLTADKIPLSSLAGNAILIDVSKNALPNRDYLIHIKDIENWEKENGMIGENEIILFRTGYGTFYPDREQYFGTGKTGAEAIPDLHFPGISPAAATWLIKNRRIKAIGIDTPSLDFGQSKDFKAHQIILQENIPGFENLANLDSLPMKGFYIMALPMKIGGGSGAPLRIVAGIKK